MDLLKRILLIFSVALVLGTIVLTTSVNWFALRNTDKVLEEVSGLGVQIRSARLGLFSGARFNGIAMSRRDEEKAPMLRADWMQLDAPPDSLTDSLVTADSLRIGGLALLLSRNDRDDTNYTQLLSDISRHLPAGSDTADRQSDTSNAGQRRYLIEEIKITGLSVRGIDNSAAQGPSDVSVKKESLTLRKLGAQSGGVTIQELGASILYGVLHHVAHRERDLPPQITRELRLALSRMQPPDADLPSRSRALGDRAVDQGQAFFDRAIEAIDKFMEAGPEQLPTPAETEGQTEDTAPSPAASAP